MLCLSGYWSQASNVLMWTGLSLAIKALQHVLMGCPRGCLMMVQLISLYLGDV